jgi:hypothetical protein
VRIEQGLGRATGERLALASFGVVHQLEGSAGEPELHDFAVGAADLGSHDLRIGWGAGDGLAHLEHVSAIGVRPSCLLITVDLEQLRVRLASNWRRSRSVFRDAAKSSAVTWGSRRARKS